MENYLLKKNGSFMKKASLLLMIIFIGAGISFSQGSMKTVTSDADNGAGSLRQAIADAVDGDTIMFSGIDTIFVGEPLMLGDKSLVIDGSGGVMLDGRLTGTDADSFRIVEIIGVPDKVVMIQNLTMQYGYAKDTVGNYLLEGGGNGGGGLNAYNYAGGELILTNCTFSNNMSTAKGGGAKVYGLATITDCDFVGNSALDVEDGDGGGLYSHIATITGCTFSMNSAEDIGGGAFGDSLSTFSDCEFISNTSVDDGGGLRTSNYTSSVSDSYFELNYAGDKGGALYMIDGTALNLEVINNECVDQGGGVYLSRSAIMSDSHIAENTCSDDGGGVFVNDSSRMYNCVITGNINLVDDGGGVFVDDIDGYVENCVITNNVAKDHAGGLMLRAGFAVNCIIMGNSCEDDGGGVYLDDNRAPDQLPVLIGSLVTNNSAGESGGGMSIEGGDVYNTTFTENYSVQNGGGIRGKNGNPWKVTNSIIGGNDAGGGAKNIRIEGNTSTDVSFDFCGVDTTANTDLDATNSANILLLNDSPFVGGAGPDAYYLAAGTAPIDAGTTLAAELTPASDPHGHPRVIGAAIDMGAFEAFQGSGLVVTDKGNSGLNTLRDIVAGASDGDMITFADDIDTIFLELPIELGDKTLSIDGTIASGMVVLDGRFHKDAALDTNRVVTVKGEMGAIVKMANLTIANGNLNNGSAGAGDAELNWGGGLWANTGDASYASFKAMNCTFKNNTSVGRGGGVLSDGPNLFENCTFMDNSATDASEGRGGGAIGYFTVFEGCTFEGNSSQAKGGGALIHEGSVANNCVFDGNTSYDGGGGALVEEYALISNSTFKNNVNADTEDKGGGVYLNRGHADGLTVMNNTSADHAGGVYVNNDSWIKNSTIADNTSGDDGGGIYIDDEGGLVDNCIITGNTSVDHAGGVYNDDGILSNSTISGNSCGSNGNGDGGGVALDEIVGLVENCIISNNSSGDHGGGIMLQAGTVINCTIDGNQCVDDGGGVNIDDHYPANPGNLIGCVVSNNSSTDQGGGVYVLVGNIVNCDIVNNSSGGSGNGIRGNGTWKVINSIVYGNDVSNNTNAEAVFVSHSALDAGHGFTTEIENVIDLTESPFVGGTGDDSLHLANMALVDAGSVDVLLAVLDTVKNVLPATDIDGDPRILGPAIDFGVYETEIPPVAVTGVTLDQATLTITAGLTGTLVATVAPEDAVDKSVTWSSSNEAAATVAEGIVTAVAAGEATITVTTTDGGFTATCVVTVNPGTAAVTGVTLDQATLNLAPTETATLVATVAPADASDKSVTWSSSNEAAATVAGGVVTAVADGEATITVTTTDGGFTATCVVTVLTIGVDDAEAAGFRLYPNPVSGGVLHIELSDQSISSFEIYNALGAIVVKENVDNRTMIELNTAGLEGGLYFVKMIKTSSTSVERFVIQ